MQSSDQYVPEIANKYHEKALKCNRSDINGQTAATEM